MRDWEEAESLYERALIADSTGLPPYFNLVVAQANQGEWDRASQTLDAMLDRFGGSPTPLSLGGSLASAQGDYDAAEDRFSTIGEQWAGEPYWEAESAMALARLDAVRGRLAEAEDRVEEAQRVAGGTGNSGQVIDQALLLAFIDMFTRFDPVAAVARLDGVLERHPLDSIDPLDRPYDGVINVLAYAGESARARALLDERRTEVPAELLQPEDTERLEAAIAVSEGRYDEAIEAFRRTQVGSCLLCSVNGLAYAYDSAGRADSAIATYERYIDTAFFNRLFFDTAFRPFALERLGQLYDERGDLQNAAKYYAMFVELWTGADAELQPRVQAAQARLEEILAEIG
jgi:tetratricopeptide (TPR) repeat protein